MQYGCGRINLQYGRSTDTGVRIYSMGVVRIRAYKFKLQVYTLAAMGVPINTHVRTYGRSTLTYFCHVPYLADASEADAQGAAT